MSCGLVRFPFARDLAGFDFSAQPSIDRAQVREIGRPAARTAGCRQDAHLAVAVGREAIVAGYTVLFSRRRRR